MNLALTRWVYLRLIRGLVFLTVVIGIWGPFASGEGSTPTGREYFLPAGFVFSDHLDHKLPWHNWFWDLADTSCPAGKTPSKASLTLLAATGFGNAHWIAFAGSL